MIRKYLFAGAMALALAAPAVASQCPMDMQKIDAALQTADLSEEQKTQVMDLRAKGEEQHEAGDHAASVATLAEAKKILGIE